MNRRGFHIGPGAASLLLLAVVLSMSALGLLALYSARGDARLSARSLEVAQSVCRLNDRAERSMMALDEVLVAAAAQGEAGYLDAVARMLPENMALEGDRVQWTEQTEDGRQLNCAARILPWGSDPRAVWEEHRLSTEIEETGSEMQWN